MNYTNFTKEQLLDRIKELEVLTQEMLKEKEQETKLEYAWTGNLGHWYWNIRTNAVKFNPLKVTALGYEESEIPEYVTYQFFIDKLHPEDYQKVMDIMRNHLDGKAEVYEAEYRIQTKDGNYKWYYRILMEHLKSGTAEAARTGNPLSIAMFDIDDFKRVNDSKGYVSGDKVLVDIADIIKSSIRETDFARRYGGEEFMVIFPNTDLSEAKKISERIRQAVENHQFPEGLSVIISGGIKQYRAADLTDFIHEADTNLYKAKQNGKNQVVA